MIPYFFNTSQYGRHYYQLCTDAVIGLSFKAVNTSLAEDSICKWGCLLSSKIQCRANVPLIIKDIVLRNHFLKQYFDCHFFTDQQPCPVCIFYTRPRVLWKCDSKASDKTPSLV